MYFSSNCQNSTVKWIVFAQIQLMWCTLMIDQINNLEEFTIKIYQLQTFIA